jgi:membrane protein YdbS with pleckstrin-like domain
VPTNSQSDEDRTENQQDPNIGTTPPAAEDSAASKFRREVASKKADLDDYESEEELWSGGYSPMAMIGMWLLMGIVSVALLIVPVFTALNFLIALLLILVMWVLGGLRYAWNRLGVHYQLTNQRFIHQTGVLTRQTDRIEVIDIDDVSFTQGPVQRMLGVGRIVLSSSDRTHPTLSMVGIAEVKDVAGLIDDVRRKERRQRSLHIESI